jgi:CpeT/CpcT family (DUF1001)
MVEHKHRICAAIGLLALALLSGCASGKKAREAELSQIVDWLPGFYDNTAQIEAEKHQGLQPHDALAIAIVPIYAPMISKTVFYAQEMAPDDARRVMSQRLLAFDISEEGEIVQSIWMLQDPVRWRDAHRNPDLFKSMQPPDVQSIPGCGIRWKKESPKDGKPEHFTAAGSRNNCRSKTRAPNGSTLFVETRMELTPDEFALSDQLYDAQGKLIFGHPGDAFYRFRRRAE